jgi:hypothetical protein
MSFNVDGSLLSFGNGYESSMEIWGIPDSQAYDKTKKTSAKLFDRTNNKEQKQIEKGKIKRKEKIVIPGMEILKKMGKTQRIGIDCFTLGSYGNSVVYPDSPVWKEILKKHKKISFWCCRSEVEFGYIQRVHNGFLYKFIQGGKQREISINRDYINWFIINFYWNIYASVDYPENDIYQNIRTEPYKKDCFKFYFSVSTTYCDLVIFRKILNDFIDINPNCEITFLCDRGNMSAENFSFKQYNKTEHNVIWNIPCIVKSNSVLDYNSCFRLAGLLDGFSSGSRYETQDFKKYYGSKKHMFIDEQPKPTDRSF